MAYSTPEEAGKWTVVKAKKQLVSGETQDTDPTDHLSRRKSVRHLGGGTGQERSERGDGGTRRKGWTRKSIESGAHFLIRKEGLLSHTTKG